MTNTFDAWLNAEMTSRGIRSARRLAMEAGLNAETVADWLLGTSMPSDVDCDALGKYLQIAPDEIRELRFPRRRRPGQ